MGSNVNVGRREQIQIAVSPALDAVDRGISQFIGGLLLFGLAWGGLAIGYASVAMQWLGTSVLVVPGSFLAGSGIWNLISNKSR